MKIDTHVHSKYSPDSRMPVNMIFRTAKKNGLDAVAISDHDATGSWSESHKASKKYGIKFLQSEEITILESGIGVTHTLGFFLTDHVDAGPFPYVYDQIKEQGAMLIVCHPFEPRREHLRNPEKVMRYIDGLEVFNARVRDQKYNEIALKFAKKHKLPMTGGSDAHTRFEIGNGYTEFKGSTIEEFRKALKKRTTMGYGKKTSSLVRFASVTGKL